MNWIKYDWTIISTRPPKYGRYLIYRKKAKKMHFEIWNGNGWASSNNDCSHWCLPELPNKTLEHDYEIKINIREKYIEDLPIEKDLLFKFFMWFRNNGQKYISKSIEKMIDVYIKSCNKA